MKVKVFHHTSSNKDDLEREINKWLAWMEKDNTFFEIKERSVSTTTLESDYQALITVLVWYEDYSRGGSS